MKSDTPIIADKELFRLWYEFYRLALVSSDVDVQKAIRKSHSHYADWHGSENLRFDEWWRNHRSLFHDTNVVRITDVDEMKSEENLYVTIPRDKSYGDILEEFKTLITNELPSKKKGRKTPPKHRYAPTEIQGVKRVSLRMMLDLQKNIFSQSDLKGVALRERVLKFFSSERYRKKRNLVPMSFIVDTSNKYNDDHSAEADRNIRRYRQKAHKLLLNVANGEFPGRY
jgi:hypothetical protein